MTQIPMVDGQPRPRHPRKRILVPAQTPVQGRGPIKEAEIRPGSLNAPIGTANAKCVERSGTLNYVNPSLIMNRFWLGGSEGQTA